jgi:hypothetical protein
MFSKHVFTTTTKSISQVTCSAYVKCMRQRVMCMLPIVMCMLPGQGQSAGGSPANRLREDQHQETFQHIVFCGVTWCCMVLCGLIWCYIALRGVMIGAERSPANR